EVFFEIGDEECAHGVAGLVGGAALVGGEHDIVEAKEGFGDRRLVLENVESGAAEATALQKLHHGGFIDQRAAGDVDDKTLGAEGFEDFSRNDLFGALAAGGNDDQPIGVAGHVFETVIVYIGDSGLGAAAVIDDAHLHGLGAGRNLLANAAEAENAHGLAGEFGEKPEIGGRPFALTDELIGLGNAAGQRYHE